MNDVSTTEAAYADFDDAPEPTSLSTMIRNAVSTLRRRWLMLTSIVLVIFGTGVIAVLLITPQYEAVTRIKVDPSQSAAMGQMSEQSSFPDQAIVDTEVTVMRSLDVARAVVDKLRLQNDREFARKLPPLSPSASPAERDARANAVANELLSKMSAQREKATYIVDLAVRSTDPVKAAVIANTLAEQYIEASLNRRSGTAERQANSLTKQLNELSAQANAANAKLAEYRARSGVVASGSGLSSVTDQQIAPLAGQLATAQSEAAAAAAKVRAAETQIRANGIGGVSAVLNSDVIRNLRQQRATLLQNLGEIQTRYGPKHPDSLTIAEQLKSIDQQISDEAQRIIAGLRADAGSASARAASLAGDLAQLRGQQAGNTRSSAVAETYERQANAAQAAYDRLASQAQSSGQAARSSLAQAQVIEAAVPPMEPSAPRKGLLLALALLLAVAVGLAALALLELVSTSIRTVDDLRAIGLPTLATVPQVKRSQLRREAGGGSPADFLVAKPVGAYSEAFRTVRKSLLLGKTDPPRVIAIASTLPDEGKTTTALALARVTALSGARTLVIDADLRRAGLTKTSGVSVAKGLVEILHGEATPEQAIVADRVAGLDVLPLSDTLFSPEDLFGNGTFERMIATLRDRYETIIIDTPPFLGIADARTIAKLADAVVMVVRWNRTPRNAAKSGVTMLRQDGANVAGAVLSMVAESEEAYGAMYYSRRYSGYYEEKAAT